MTKKIDQDFLGLKWGIEAMEKTTERMRKPTLEYLYDRYILHPNKPKMVDSNHGA